MKKFYKLIIAAATIAGVMATTGCNSGNGKLKITFWHTMGQENQDMLNRVIEKFNLTHPDVEVQHDSQGSYSTLKDKLNEAIPAGTNPTMAFCYPDHVAGYMVAGAVQNLDDYINGEATQFTKEDGSHVEDGVIKYGKDDYIEAFWGEGTQYSDRSGKKVTGTYSVPFAKSTEVIFYNKAAFESHNWTVPTTWEEMDAFMRRDDVKEWIDAKPETLEKRAVLGYDSDDNLFITMCEQYGLPYTANAEKKADRFLFNTPEAKAMVQGINDWYQNGYLLTQATNGNSNTSSLLTSEALLMSIGSTGGTRYNWSAPTATFEVSIAPIPGATQDATEDVFFSKYLEGGRKGAVTNNNHVISQGPGICIFARATDEQKAAAWDFYKILSNSFNNATYSINTGYQPVRISSYDDPDFVDYIKLPKAGESDADIQYQAEGKYKILTQTGLYRYSLVISSELTARHFTSPAFVGSSQAREEVGGIIANYLLGTKTLDGAFSSAIDACLLAA